MLSYAVLVTQDSVLYALITLLLIVPVVWVWIRIFRIEISSSSNDGGTKPNSAVPDTQQIINEIQERDSATRVDSSKDQILRELKKHEDHYPNATCLDCGYEGIAGVVGAIVPWYVTWWVIIPLCFTAIGLLGGFILGLARASQTKMICECPQCGSNSLIG